MTTEPAATTAPEAPKKPRPKARRFARAARRRLPEAPLTVDRRGTVRRSSTAERLGRERVAAQARAARWDAQRIERLKDVEALVAELSDPSQVGRQSGKRAAQEPKATPAAGRSWRELRAAERAVEAVKAERAPKVPPDLGARPWDAPRLEVEASRSWPAGTRERGKRTYPYGLPADLGDASRRAADRELRQRERRAAAAELGCAMRDLRPAKPLEPLVDAGGLHSGGVRWVRAARGG